MTQSECLALIDRLIAAMGINAYCIWLADTLDGRGNWTDNAPLADIARVLSAQGDAVRGDGR